MHKYHIIPAGGGRLAPFTGTLHKGGAGRDTEPRLCKERSCCQWADKGGSGDKNHICSAGISSFGRRLQQSSNFRRLTQLQTDIPSAARNEHIRAITGSIFHRRENFNNWCQRRARPLYQDLYSLCIDREPEGGAA